jgi:hypothetical protein
MLGLRPGVVLVLAALKAEMDVREQRFGGAHEDSGDLFIPAD